MPFDVISYSLTKRKAEKFKQLRDTPDSYTGYASKFVIVNASEDGLTFGDVPPSGGWSLKKVTADYTASSNEFVLADASATAITITLPSPSANARVAVKKIDSSTNEVVVDAGTSKIDGSSTKTLKTQYEAYEFYCDGTDWYIL
ncbi:MAG: hypothetical protein DRN64_03595 [Thaumarchaeota archaeon]|nr:MAG: hypothetical protein DRN64_03595 [Nitrososphaerota archaeon]